ncbi:hypothetical protein BGZ95_011435 [Linnemannia exigua]|uniref:FAD-binding domain-containing protein n=1 Tax=Linnemannia exigua TaxID=604196 RepID=A0AAD4DK39_9FUNG|nr:hypothetical protein BGZ95_011435 [Linnemannia exigua]
MAPDPCIVIVGAGIAGLSLAIMLERAGMRRYVILERAPEYRSFGSAIVLSAMMLRCFEQLGMLDELIAVSKPMTGAVFLDENMKYIGSLPSIFIGQRYGYFNIILPRPEFHRILQSRVPLNKVYFSKKVLEVTQTSERAKIRCSDNSIYHADIVIGADGAYSGIRQSIYRSILSDSRRPPTGFEKKGLVSTLKKFSSAASYPSLSSLHQGSSSPSSLGLHGVQSSLSSAGTSSLQGLGGASMGASTASVASSSTSASIISTASMMSTASSSTASKYGGGYNRRGEVRLPKSDQEPLRFDQHAMVGITNSLDPEKYPFLKDKSCQAITILPKSGFSVWLFPVTENRICWGLSAKDFVPSSNNSCEGSSRRNSSHQPNFKVSEWGPETVDEIMQLKSVRDQKSPYGGTMAEIYDQTPKGTSLRFMIEDKAFKTWYYKRTVLVGDACHKMVPFAGVGAVNAIMDCIVLVNCLYDMPDGEAFAQADITAAFQSYYAQRADAAIAAVKGSNKVSAMVGSNSALSLKICKASIASMPETLVCIAADRIFASRPILTFLPFVPDYGERKSNPQPLGRRDREELEALREKERLDRIKTAERKKEERKVRRLKSKPGSSLLRIVGVGGGGGSSSGGANSSSNNNGSSSKVGSGGGRILMAKSATSQYPASTPSVTSFALSTAMHTSCLLPRPVPIPRHDHLDGSAPIGANGLTTTSLVTASLSIYDSPSFGSHSRNGGDSNLTNGKNPFIEAYSETYSTTWFSPEYGDSYDDSDTHSIYSFSSRYTLPYDSETLATQYYTGRRAVFPYMSPSENPLFGAESSKFSSVALAPVTAEAIASLNRRDSNISILSTLWRRYGRRNNNNDSRRLSNVSLQSSTISGIGFRGFRGGYRTSEDDGQQSQLSEEEEEEEEEEEGVVLGAEIDISLPLMANFSSTESDKPNSSSPSSMPIISTSFEAATTIATTNGRAQDEREGLEDFYHGMTMVGGDGTRTDDCDNVPDYYCHYHRHRQTH